MVAVEGLFLSAMEGFLACVLVMIVVKNNTKSQKYKIDHLHRKRLYTVKTHTSGYGNGSGHNHKGR